MKVLPRVKLSKIKKKKKNCKERNGREEQKKIQAMEYCKRRKQRIGKFPDSVEMIVSQCLKQAFHSQIKEERNLIIQAREGVCLNA